MRVSGKTAIEDVPAKRRKHRSHTHEYLLVREFRHVALQRFIAGHEGLRQRLEAIEVVYPLISETR